MQKPSIIKNVLLLSPGIWNETEYTSDEIAKSFNNTDWNIKKNRNLFLDHQDTKERGVGNWVGYISNPRLEKNSELWGDLEIWNPLVSSYLKEAKAPFGISATLGGFENLENKSDGAKGKMENFHYESFSIVTDPACKKAQMNLSENKAIKIVTLSQKGSDDIEDEDEEIDDLDLDDEELAKNNQSDADLNLYRCKEVKMEEAKKLEENVVEKVEENKCEEMPEEAKKKLEEDNLLMSSMKTDIDSLKLSLQSLQEEISKLVSVKENEVKKEELKVEDTEALELEKVKKELSELKEEFGRPDRKTLSFDDGSIFSGDANEAMLGFLQDRLY
jgi:hypothetical protein